MNLISFKRKLVEVFPRAMAACVLAVVAASFLGRLLGTAAPEAVFPALHPIRLNASICLVLLAVALWLLAARNFSTRHRAAVFVLAIGTIALSGATVADWLFQFDPGIDQLFYTDGVDALRRHTGRMPLFVAVDFVLFALAVLLIDAERTRALGHLLALAIAANYVFVLIRFAYGAVDMDGGDSLWAVSLHGSVASLLLAAGIFFARPSGGLLSLLGLRLRQAAIAGLVLMALFAATAWSWYESRNHLAHIARAGFEADVATVKSEIEERLSKHTAVLAAVNSFLSADYRHLERAEIRAYVERLQVEQLLPGVMSVGFAPVLTHATLEAHVRGVRAEGFPEYRIWPPGIRDMYVPVTVLEPMAPRSRASLGFDMFSDPTRRRAMLAAADSGLAAVSGLVRLTGDVSDPRPPQPGFIVYLAYYRSDAPRVTSAQRRAALAGFVYTPLRAYDFFESSLTEINAKVGVEIFDLDELSEQGLLYRSVARTRAIPELRSDTPLAVNGRRWTIRAFKLRAVSDGILRGRLPDALLLGGGALSVLLVALGLALTKVRAHSRDLDHKAGEMTQLADALKDSNTELQRFAYVASHDLRAPIRAIAGYARVLQESMAHKLTEEENSFIARIARSTQHMQEMIEALLYYARIDTKAKVFTQVDLSQAGNTAVEMLHASITEAGARVEVEPLPTVMGDSVQLAELLQNLIANALTYRSDALPVIRISSARIGEEHVISVQDNGIGIDAAHHEQIFEMFRRLPAHNKVSGTGIGLATCRRIMQRHGGRIWLESSVGKGSTFKFALAAI